MTSRKIEVGAIHELPLPRFCVMSISTSVVQIDLWRRSAILLLGNAAFRAKLEKYGY
ncbi:hypothetical protein [Chamaesiphon sp. VAR_48_metabat_403]|uniref:hypothetical protein n=1 Tax=Chamaesiphon sp. VAR_48_metabat_403 TaxID=2964700 RepID=UPI00286E684D|nr:hypothetical protein [Chamaesiphon sp. VAR_48_metabat_403]